MTLSRREVLVGTAAVAAAAAITVNPLASAAPVSIARPPAPDGRQRPPLLPLGALQVHYPDDRGFLMMMGRWYRRPWQHPSREQQAAAILNIYWGLVDDVVIEGADLDHLGLVPRAKLINIRRQFIRAPQTRLDFIEHDLAVCRLFDHEVSRVVADGWPNTPTARVLRRRAAVAALRKELRTA
jgi:hypothetical protein